MKYLKQLEKHLHEATSLHLLQIPPQQERGRLEQKLSEVSQQFSDTISSRLHTLHVSYSNLYQTSVVTLFPLLITEFFPPRTVILPNGKAVSKHPVSQEKQLLMYESYLSSLTLYSSRYRGELLHTDDIIIAVSLQKPGENEDQDTYYFIKKISRMARQNSIHITSGATIYLKHNSSDIQ